MLPDNSLTIMRSLCSYILLALATYFMQAGKVCGERNTGCWVIKRSDSIDNLSDKGGSFAIVDCVIFYIFGLWKYMHYNFEGRVERVEDNASVDCEKSFKRKIILSMVLLFSLLKMYFFSSPFIQSLVNIFHGKDNNKAIKLSLSYSIIFSRLLYFGYDVYNIISHQSRNVISQV